MIMQRDSFNRRMPNRMMNDGPVDNGFDTREQMRTRRQFGAPGFKIALAAPPAMPAGPSQKVRRGALTKI